MYRTYTENIYKRLCSNKLSLNCDKIESLLVGSRKMLMQLSYVYKNKVTQSQETVKYLGVIIDQ